jgi:polysaccharide biosynthesis transport protein
MENPMQRTSSLEAARAIWRRRKWVALSVLMAALSASVAVVLNLPNVYESTATLLVEHQQIPEGLAGPSAESELETRLRTTGEQILGRSALYELVTQLGIDPDPQQRAAFVEQMRQAIQLQFNGASSANGKDETVWLSLSYRGSDPETVARITNALAAIYVRENARITGRETEGTTDLLRLQLEDAKDRLEAQEQRLSAFKRRYIGELPEQQAVSLAAVERITERVHEIAIERGELTKQLGETPTVAGVPVDTVASRLLKLREQLADLRTRFTDEYPSVAQVKQEIADLERQRAAGPSKPSAEAASTMDQPADPPSPARVELTALDNEEQLLRREMAGYEQRVENAPLREQELQQLTQDYTVASQLYLSLLQRYQSAFLTERMDLQGEQFRILDPALVSTQPVAPKRLRLLLMGLMLSLGAAAGTVLLAEVNDTSFHTVDDVRAFTSVPVLVSIPLIVTPADARKRRRRSVLSALAVMLGIAAVFGVTSFLVLLSQGLIQLPPVGRF